ncbi:unnamed protein product [Pseudo-nitzschia multistriata]|uniref:Uncharacterized protein n=1 Tax=Pseudo-nitzschia multistriata TaxID=183589 RepID=A0A448Z2X6_9STRA|nr:unnamed protein product [Pseudo-nitzschia multistriata]
MRLSPGVRGVLFVALALSSGGRDSSVSGFVRTPTKTATMPTLPGREPRKGRRARRCAKAEGKKNLLVVDRGETVPEEEWIRRMLEHLSRDGHRLVAGKRIVLVASSRSAPPSSRKGQKHSTASLWVSRLASRAKSLCLVVSEQEEEDEEQQQQQHGLRDGSENGGSSAGGAGPCSILWRNTEVVGSTELEDLLRKAGEGGDKAIDAIVLSTTSAEVVHNDPFVNDFLRRTDAPIHMSSDCADGFCYYSRLQEGANIVLW